MAPHLSPPFRAEHMGSLRRPKYLLEKRAEFDAGKVSREDLRPSEEKAIREIVALQKDIGLKAVTDGEYTRYKRILGLALRTLAYALCAGTCSMMEFSTIWMGLCISRTVRTISSTYRSRLD